MFLEEMQIRVNEIPGMIRYLFTLIFYEIK